MSTDTSTQTATADPAEVSGNYWFFDGVPVGYEGSQPIRQPGKEDDYELFFAPGGGPEIANHKTRFEALRERPKHANTLDMDVDFYDSVKYTDAALGESLLISVEPGAYDDIDVGFWGLITGGSAGDVVNDSLCKLSLSIAYVADLDEYADKAAVRREHEREGWIR